MKSRIYQNSLSRQAKYLFAAIGKLILVAGICYALGGSVEGVILCLSIVFILDTIPALIVHINYLIKTKGSIVEINEQTIKIVSSKMPIEIPINDISEIFKIRSSVSYFSSRYSFANYHYYVFNNPNGVEIIITCLMTKSEAELFSYDLNRLCNEKREFYPIIR